MVGSINRLFARKKWGFAHWARDMFGTTRCAPSESIEGQKWIAQAWTGS